jgi:hypothetical protein
MDSGPTDNIHLATPQCNRQPGSQCWGIFWRSLLAFHPGPLDFATGIAPGLLFSRC